MTFFSFFFLSLVPLLVLSFLFSSFSFPLLFSVFFFAFFSFLSFLLSFFFSLFLFSNLLASVGRMLRIRYYVKYIHGGLSWWQAV